MKNINAFSYWAGTANRILWLLSTQPFKENISRYVQFLDVSEQHSLHWEAITPSFLQRALSGCNLIPNSDFGAAELASLDAWQPEVESPAAIGVDFGDNWRPDNGHALYLFAPAEAPRPALRLAEPLPVLSGHGLIYQFSGFFATHRGDAVIEITWLDQASQTIDTQMLRIDNRDDRIGGRSLTDYRWLHWTFQAPTSARWITVCLRLGEHSGSGDASSFLFATRLFFGVVDPARPAAWTPTVPGARTLIEQILSGQWLSAALVQIPVTLPEKSSATAMIGDDISFEVHIESSAALGQPSDSDAIVNILPPIDGRLGWAALRWPLSDAITTSVDGIKSGLRIEPGPLHTHETLMASLLLGENLLPNAGFDDTLAAWETLDGCGVDYSPSTCLAEGHVAYIRRKIKQERDATRLYSHPIALPSDRQTHRYWLSGHLAYHRCLGHLGLEWLDATGASLGLVQLEPASPKARGGARLEDFDHQGALLDAPTDAVSARLFLEKSLTQPGRDDSFLFFTRLFFGLAEHAPVVWKPMDPAYLERLRQFAVSADYFQPLIHERLEQAEAASRAENWPLADELWRSILAVCATGAVGVCAHVRLAEAQHQQGTLADAEATLRVGIQRFPESPELLIAAAEFASARQDWSEANQRWGQVLELGSGELPTRCYLQYSTALCQQQRCAEAEQLVATRMEHDPKDLLLAIAYAEIAMSQQHWSKAVKRWQGIAEFGDGIREMAP